MKHTFNGYVGDKEVLGEFGVKERNAERQSSGFCKKDVARKKLGELGETWRRKNAAKSSGETPDSLWVLRKSYQMSAKLHHKWRGKLLGRRLLYSLGRGSRRKRLSGEMRKCRTVFK